ncbi:MAG TPA: chemotaxis protein CheA [Gemmatimonadaceae bacterium]|nr:chemotaxis protein CheA [Gemmatimonadaceae bacterium]
MELSRYADLFLTESKEHLSAMNQLLLALEKSPRASEPVAGLFRAVHTVKGMSATMGYGAVTALAHEMESLLDLVRQGARPVTPAMMDLLFRGADALERAIARAASGGGDDEGAAALAATFREEAGGKGGARRSALGARPASGKGGARRAGGGARRSARGARQESGKRKGAARGGVTVRVRMKENVVLKGARAFLVVKRAEGLGKVTGVEPSLDDLQAERFEREFGLTLVTTSDPDAIVRTLKGAGEVERVWVESGAEVAPGTNDAASPPATEATRHVRIDLRRLDTLMDLVGELVIARGQLQQQAGAAGDQALDDTVGQASRLVGELQDEIMRCRMVPVAQVFDRFPRMVRDAARSLGKEVDFIVEGQESELDRSMLDEIGDPVVHLLRNAVDHGIELPAERERAGKPRAGRLVLSIARDRGAVTIQVSDDGRGVDRRKVLEKARELGLVERGATRLTDDELVRLIARPGFTTAERVTSLSGRGVGIDVVSTRVRALGGSVDIRSAEGQGTTVTARLPLTLAIVRAMLARAAGETYAVPMTHVTETVELEAAAVQTVRGREAIVLRDDVLPLVRLRERVGLPGSAAARQQVVLVSLGERRAALVVDELAGQQDIVVKQFDPVRGGLPLFSGATILPDGAPGLILDVGSLL